MVDREAGETLLTILIALAFSALALFSFQYLMSSALISAGRALEVGQLSSMANNVFWLKAEGYTVPSSVALKERVYQIEAHAVGVSFIGSDGSQYRFGEEVE